MIIILIRSTFITLDYCCCRKVSAHKPKRWGLHNWEVAFTFSFFFYFLFPTFALWQNWQQNLSCATCWPPLQPMLMAPSAQLSVYPALFLTSWCLSIRLSINPAKKWPLILIQLFISADCRIYRALRACFGISLTILLWRWVNLTSELGKVFNIYIQVKIESEEGTLIFISS